MYSRHREIDRRRHPLICLMQLWIARAISEHATTIAFPPEKKSKADSTENQKDRHCTEMAEGRKRREMDV